MEHETSPLRTNTVPRGALLVLLAAASMGCATPGAEPGWPASFDVEVKVAGDGAVYALSAPLTASLYLPDREYLRYEWYFEVDGVAADFEGVAYSSNGGLSMPSTSFDTSGMAPGTHTVYAVATIEDGRTFEATTTFEVGEALVLTEYGPVSPDGAFDTGIEPELHVYDATTHEHLGCRALAGAPPFLLWQLGGTLFTREALATRSIYVRLTENDDRFACPSAPSLGNAGLYANDDDLVGESTAFGATEVDGGLTFPGLATFAFGRGQ